MNEYNDKELASKINASITPTSSERFGRSADYKVRGTRGQHNFDIRGALNARKNRQILRDRDRSHHFFRVASPRFNANR